MISNKVEKGKGLGVDVGYGMSRWEVVEKREGKKRKKIWISKISGHEPIVCFQLREKREKNKNRKKYE